MKFNEYKKNKLKKKTSRLAQLWQNVTKIRQRNVSIRGWQGGYETVVHRKERDPVSQKYFTHYSIFMNELRWKRTENLLPAVLW